MFLIVGTSGLSPEPRKLYHTPTVGAIACVVFGGAFALHELTHAFVAAIFGGSSLLVTSFEMRGDLREVSDLGHVAISASGSAANWRSPDSSVGSRATRSVWPVVW